ncbi:MULTISPECIES: aldo/keto reductase [unclassified Streptomyces]|uniref:aldo/keto reductase n=1 Tax=unclassified Streptomyces TaxID=2593676 RepID=UPI00081D3FC9|nr:MULTISPECIES: aldo/keto reductase [unclassified Streptomyces]MYR27023.1 aldo/keto reductase [Streptomyces sp. SID4945]SCD80336.1 Aldo/keto reductase [Streptomyces sp. TverLS-915]SCF16612.1 Aldo/keto reductase [Streptomyces sp. LcepLS]
MTTPAPLRGLSDGHRLPALGLGTYPLDDAGAESAVRTAAASGYRLFDTAVNYRNETGTGRGIAACGLPREELYVTTKLPGRDHGYEETLKSFDASRQRLGVEYVDLYLIHWPLPRVGKYVDAWRAMIKLRDEGLVRSLGVSNFTPEHVRRLEAETGVLPTVNQIEMHPLLPQDELRAFHREKAIVTQSWSPLGRGSELLDDPAIGEVAARHGVTPAQVVLRWHLQLGALPVPKSADPGRQRANLDVFGFELSDDELRRIGERPERRLGGDPDTHEEF